jgi:hypothetical protein
MGKREIESLDPIGWWSNRQRAKPSGQGRMVQWSGKEKREGSETASYTAALGDASRRADPL